MKNEINESLFSHITDNLYTYSKHLAELAAKTEGLTLEHNSEEISMLLVEIDAMVANVVRNLVGGRHVVDKSQDEKVRATLPTEEERRMILNDRFVDAVKSYRNRLPGVTLVDAKCVMDAERRRMGVAENGPRA